MPSGLQFIQYSVHPFVTNDTAQFLLHLNIAAMFGIYH